MRSKHQTSSRWIPKTHPPLVSPHHLQASPPTWEKPSHIQSHGSPHRAPRHRPNACGRRRAPRRARRRWRYPSLRRLRLHLQPCQAPKDTQNPTEGKRDECSQKRRCQTRKKLCIMRFLTFTRVQHCNWGSPTPTRSLRVCLANPSQRPENK